MIKLDRSNHLAANRVEIEYMSTSDTISIKKFIQSKQKQKQ